MKKILIIGIIILTVLIAGLYYSMSLKGTIDGNGSTEVYSDNSGIQGVTEFPVSERAGITRAEIAARYSTYIDTSPTEDKFTKFSDIDGTISLLQFADALEVDLYPSLIPLLNEHDWSVYRCQDSMAANMPSLVLFTKLALLPNYSGSLYSDKILYMSAWEDTLATDVESMLFPLIEASPIAVGFVDGAQSNVYDVRESELRFSDGSKGEIGYILVGDNVLIGNNIGCLNNARKQVFDLEA